MRSNNKEKIKFFSKIIFKTIRLLCFIFVSNFCLNLDL